MPNNGSPSRSEDQPQPSSVHRIFYGPDGLRAGWSVLIFGVLFAVLYLISSLVEHSLRLFTPEDIQAIATYGISARLFFLSELIPLLIVLLITWIMSRIEHRPVSIYGFRGPRRISHFLAGVAWGILCLSLLVFTLWKSDLLAIDGRLLFGARIFRYGAIWIIGFLTVALFEESIARGYLQYTFTRGLTGLSKKLFGAGHTRAWGFWSSAVIFSSLFGLTHDANPGESPIGLLGAGLIALALCLSLWRSGSLWWAIGFHASWDWAQSFLYGVADSGTMVQHHLLATRPVGRAILSGGTTGPEGSIFILPTVALVGLIICFTVPQTDNAYTQNPPESSPQPNGIV